MEEKEKYYAEMEARLTRMNETLTEMKLRQEKRKERIPDNEFARITERQGELKNRLEDLKKIHHEEDMWRKLKAEIDQLANDIDEDTRSAMAYAPF